MKKRIIDDFQKEKGIVKHAEYFLGGATPVPIYTINNFHLLTQFVGYAKYVNREYGNVYLRGQTKQYNTMIPSLLRGTTNPLAHKNTACRHITSAIKSSSNLKDMHKDKLTPLLQHYGIKTDWLDLVDNLWIALWFGLHDAETLVIDGHEHVYISDSNDENFAYIYLILADACKQKQPGVWYGDESVITDLRKACPSIYLRPHAQHALMIHKKGAVSEDYSDFIVGVAKISVKDGFNWIGHKGLLSVQSLFPPTHYDYGYRILLQEYNTTKKPSNFFDQFGSIQFISH